MQHLDLFLLATREAHAELAIEIGAVHVERIGEFLDFLAELLVLELLAFRLDYRAQEAAQWHAGNLDRSLKTQEQPGLAAFLGREIGDVFAIESDFASSDVVNRIAHQHMAKRRLARAIRAHEHMDFPSRHLQVDFAENRLLLDRRRQATTAQQRIAHRFRPILLMHGIPRRRHAAARIIAGPNVSPLVKTKIFS